MDADPRSSQKQRRLLESARESGVYSLIRGLGELLDSKESLDPAWRELWHTYRPQAIAEYGLGPDMLTAIDKAGSSIEMIDPSIRKIVLREQDRVCLLLGAGASAPPPSSIPTVAGLLPEMWRRARKLG